MIWQAFSDGISIFIEKWPLVLASVAVTCLGCSLVFSLSRNTSEEKTLLWRSVWLLIFFFILSVFLRLAFLAELLVPPYFDSVEHYRITQELVTAMESSTTLEAIPTLIPSYYHLGFHLLASLLTFGLRANPIDMILILGQVVLAAIPIPLFFLIRKETQNDLAAFLGALLAGFGWYMPGFAVNWGKYPALAGLLTLEFILSSAYFISLRKPERNQPLLIGLLIIGILVSTLFHTRTLFVIATAIASWWVAGSLKNWNSISRYMSLGILLAGTLILGIIVWQSPLLKLTLDPYVDDGRWVTLAVLLLSPLAFLKFPRAVYFCTLFILTAFADLFIPIGNLLPGLENQTLLDRPFVEMLLYLPLSILGGLGLASLLNFLVDTKILTERIRQYAGILSTLLFLGIAIVLVLRNYDFYPSDCCNFVNYDDTIALDWLDEKLPSDAHILIAGTQMNVLPSGPSDNLAGTDAGIWISALTGRNTTLAPFEIDFRSPDTLEQLCQQQIDFIFIGSTDQSFNVSQLQVGENWYEAVLSLPDAQFYRVAGCFK